MTELAAGAATAARHGSLVHTKLHPPLYIDEIAPRPRIIDLFEARPGAALTLLVAAAGFGKTTAMVQCYCAALARGEAVGWLTLDEGDSDAKSLLAYLVAALVRAGAPLDDLMSDAQARLIGTSEQVVLDLMIERIAACDADLLLFIDDLQTIRQGPAHALVEKLVLRAPRRLRLAIASRFKPDFAVSQLRLTGRLSEISADDLAFRPEEYHPHFGFDKPTAALIHDRCDGWPVAVKMAQLWFDAHPAGSGQPTLPILSGRDGDFADYLTEQVLRSLSPRLRAVLLRISILNHFDGDLINALCGYADGWDIIDEIKQRALLVMVSADDRASYSFHALFRSFLHERLLREARAELPSLHVAAARWLASIGRFDEAVAHACQSGDADYLASFLDDAGGWSLALSAGIHGLAPLRDWSAEKLEALPPEIGFITAYLLVQRGELDRARAIRRRVVARLDADSPPATRLSADVIAAVFNLYEDVALDIDAMAVLREVAQDVASAKPLLRICVEALSCYAAFHCCEFNRSIALGRSTIEQFAAHHGFYAASYVQLFVGLAHFELGRLDEAERMFREARETTAAHYGSQSGQAAMSDIFLAELLYLRGDIEAAHRLLQSSFEREHISGAWSDVLVSGYATLGGIAAAAGTVEVLIDKIELDEIAATEKGMTERSMMLRALRLRLLVRVGAIERARPLAEAPDVLRLVEDACGARPFTWRIVEPLRHAVALFRLGNGDASGAMRLIEASLAQARATGSIRRTLEMSLLQAAALHHQCRIEPARAVLLHAWEVGVARGFHQMFRDHAALLGPLGTALRDRAEQLPDGLAQLFESFFPARAASGGMLSARERDILGLLAAGMSSKDMARTLSLAEGTVKVHRKRLYRKLNASGRYAALNRAREYGLLAGQAGA